MDPQDFNQTEPWCPRVRGAAPGSPCANVTARHLLNMGSGLVDTDNCAYEDGAWQRQHCTTDEQVSRGWRGDWRTDVAAPMQRVAPACGVQPST